MCLKKQVSEHNLRDLKAILLAQKSEQSTTQAGEDEKQEIKNMIDQEVAKCLALKSSPVTLPKVEVLTSDEEHGAAVSAAQSTDTADGDSSSASSDHENDQKREEPTVQALVPHQDGRAAGPEE